MGLQAAIKGEDFEGRFGPLALTHSRLPSILHQKVNDDQTHNSMGDRNGYQRDT